MVCPQASEVGEVMASVPDVRASVPVTVQVVPASTALPHPAACAAPPASSTGPSAPPATSRQAATRGRRNRPRYLMCTPERKDLVVATGLSSAGPPGPGLSVACPPQAQH